MLSRVERLIGSTLHATDGDIGSVEELYFDDERWGVRYLVVDTGGWLGGRKVLVSPRSVSAHDAAQRAIHVDLTRRQVQDSPSIEADKPVSRQQEMLHVGYYGHPGYWSGPLLWGVAALPVPAMPMAGQVVDPVEEDLLERAQQEQAAADQHLRSSKEVAGYGVRATDGDIGHVEDFLFDDVHWALRFLIVDTRNWWPGKKVLVSPQWVTSVDWPAQRVEVELTREQIKGSPPFDAGRPLEREEEARLYRHYGRPGYWTEPAASSGEPHR
jgi:uncharacterized protein YrrD